VLVPKLVTTLKDYSREQLTRDVIAGVIVGIVALPLAIAFAIASRLTRRGLYTAIIAGFVISALGGSRVNWWPDRRVRRHRRRDRTAFRCRRTSHHNAHGGGY
jgi:hypothetical protein